MVPPLGAAAQDLVRTSGLGEAIRRGEGREVLRGPVQVPFDLANRWVERALPRWPRGVARDAVASVGILGLREVAGADSFRDRPDSIPRLPRVMEMLREALEGLRPLPEGVEREVDAELREEVPGGRDRLQPRKVRVQGGPQGAPVADEVGELRVRVREGLEEPVDAPIPERVPHGSDVGEEDEQRKGIIFWDRREQEAAVS